MSWTKRSQETLYRDFTEKAAGESLGIVEKPWSLEVLDISEDGQLGEYVQNTVRRLTGKPRLRIVFAPSDIPRRETKGLMVELFHKFGIPHDFTAERARSTTHSFSRRSDENNGFSSWFRFSSISVALAGADDESPDSEGDVTERTPLAEKFPERESAFFLQASNDACTTSVCFGAGPGVKKRMHDLVKSQGWTDIGINPYILFDVALEGLHEEVDDTALRIEEEFTSLEQSIIRLTGSECESSGARAPLGELYTFERHVTELSRALESVVMINEGVLMNARIPSTTTSVAQSQSSEGSTDSDRRPLVDLQLKECLDYRHTLFRSTQLRLSHLQKRIEAATALASNLVSQQQSAAVIQGPVSMKLIAASILIFLPTITVATIAGSRLLLSEQLDEDGSWDVSATPLFYLLWYISIPLTLAVVVVSFCWLRWRRRRSKKVAKRSSWFRKVVIWRHMKGEKGDRNESSIPV
ncbi:hypothetical protein TrVGV298_007474 [Trichoderma virens]|nr:hypothetical protein TrVGV298_007474 [Trichoderma virens]